MSKTEVNEPDPSFIRSLHLYSIPKASMPGAHSKMLDVNQTKEPGNKREKGMLYQ